MCRVEEEITMRQTFTFAESRHKPPQALAALKNRIRKYVKRERRKALPEGVDYWDFDCKVGETEEGATEVHIAQVTERMEAVFDANSPTVYVEILAKPGVRSASGKASSPKTSQRQAKSGPSTARPAKAPAKRDDNAPASDADEIVPSSDWSFG